jgi:hypothetical protein
MNAKLISLPVTAALFGSSALAGPPLGRDSVYAEAGNTSIKATPLAAVNNRIRVHATALRGRTSLGNLKFEGA